ncbi:penicillin-binding protein activator [Devosia sp. BSSL-BM10]|uniref:Penicillin-binding protein activator n=1 Tax=Devosia litorisediminis TaxID=2829817 RepID=A0A942E966_9HYPH|nr:penicillin-binding protein activator [Devosia litorisediminis]MBS3850413.1 penicillin-binding protein activator [Devosia litorisediminis]
MTGWTRTGHRLAQRGITQAFAIVGLFVLSACSPIHIASRTIDFGFGGSSQPTAGQTMTPLTTAGPGQVFGRGPVQVALLLPLTGNAGLASVGQSMANGSRLAMAFIEANPNIAENTTITLRDTGGTVAGATSATQAAIASGAKLILGPLRGDSVTAAGAAARAAGVPLIGFSNNPGAAGPGVYLLSVLPDMEMKRALSYVKAKGRRGVAGAFPSSAYGQALQTAFRQQAVQAGLSPSAVYTFSGASEVSQVVSQALPLIKKGLIDTLFIPDRATAPAFGAQLAQAGVSPADVQIVGSADWEGDTTIAATPSLSGALYPAVDPAGMAAIRADYQARFNSQPHALATIAYTATILANVNTLSLANPPYNPMLMTAPTGFNGRDGVFRFLSNGRSEYALALMQVGAGGASRLEGPKL